MVGRRRLFSPVAGCLVRAGKKVMSSVERIAVDALEEIAKGDGFYGLQAREYKQVARKALNDIAHQARKEGRHSDAAWIYGILNGHS
jgi:hypothetical protein